MRVCLQQSNGYAQEKQKTGDQACETEDQTNAQENDAWISHIIQKIKKKL